MASPRYRAPPPTVPEQWDAFTTDHLSRVAPPPPLPQLLTGAMRRLCGRAAELAATRVYTDALAWADTPGGPGSRAASRPAGPEPAVLAWEATYLSQLPANTWTCGRAWRLQMARAFADLAGDLADGRAPAPRCIAEDIAVVLILADAHELAGKLEGDPHAARDLIGMDVPTGLAGSDLWAAAMDELLKDACAYLLWDCPPGFDHPDHPVNRRICHGQDLRPPVWFNPFGNVVPRDPGRGHPPWVDAQEAETGTGAEPVDDPEGAWSETDVLASGPLAETAGSTPAVRANRLHVLAGHATDDTPIPPGLAGWHEHGVWVIPDEPHTAVAQAQHLFRKPRVVCVLWNGPDGSLPGTVARNVEVLAVKVRTHGPDARARLLVRWADSIGSVRLADLVAVTRAADGTQPSPE